MFPFFFEHATKHRRRRAVAATAAVGLVTLSLVVAGPVVAVRVSDAAESPRTKVNLAGYNQACGIEMVQQGTVVNVTWPAGNRRQGRLVFDLDLDGSRPLIRDAAFSSQGAPFQTIAAGLDPVLLIRVGKRDLAKRGGWTVFFDRMQRKPSELFAAKIGRASAVATSTARRATLTIGEVTAGPFRGKLRWTFYAGQPFVLQEAVLRTDRPDVAYLYDTGLVCRAAVPQRMVWRDASDRPAEAAANGIDEPRNLPVHGRAIAADFDHGSILLMPPPHRYFYPLDFSDNLRNIWVGPDYLGHPMPFGFGIRHDARGDNRHVPWFNAPPDTRQELGVFVRFSDQAADRNLQESARLTRNDRFAPLPGYKVFSSHYHVEHTRELLDAQEQPADDDDQVGHLPAGGTYRIPRPLIDPGFRRAFRQHGIDVVQLAEFHFGRTPRMTLAERVRHLEHLHAECRRLSDVDFLLLPGEEPNVHLGGHWISFFPRPVYWVLNRKVDQPFVVDDPHLGRVYRVGDEADVLRLLRAENGLAWTAHPRIKGSSGFPDRYRDRLFFQSDRFLGAAWKAMPADLSQPRLGSRVLDLMNDMANWGSPKYVVGEVDVFKIEPQHELYGHLNVNYLRLPATPRFDNGWQPVLDCLRAGQFFVTTGEVLIPTFMVEGASPGERAVLAGGGQVTVQIELDWTFPLDYAEIIMGDGLQTRRQRIDLSETGAFGRDTFNVSVPAAGQRWLRLEVWDVATNGAFTQPVWLTRPSG